MSSWSELRDMLENNKFQTRFEKAQGIVAVDYTLAYDSQALKIAVVEKSDGTFTLYLLVKQGLYTDRWFFWPISEPQAEFMIKEFPGLYRRINGINRLKRGVPR